MVLDSLSIIIAQKKWNPEHWATTPAVRGSDMGLTLMPEVVDSIVCCNSWTKVCTLQVKSKAQGKNFCGKVEFGPRFVKSITFFEKVDE